MDGLFFEPGEQPGIAPLVEALAVVTKQLGERAQLTPKGHLKPNLTELLVRSREPRFCAPTTPAPCCVCFIAVGASAVLLMQLLRLPRRRRFLPAADCRADHAPGGQRGGDECLRAEGGRGGQAAADARLGDAPPRRVHHAPRGQRRVPEHQAVRVHGRPRSAEGGRQHVHHAAGAHPSASR